MSNILFQRNPRNQRQIFMDDIGNAGEYNNGHGPPYFLSGLRSLKYRKVAPNFIKTERAPGAQFIVKDGKSTNRVPGNFDTNYIDPVGSPSWGTTCWNYHQYGWAGSKVYDASLKVDSDGTPESSPHTALLPTKLTESTFKGYLVKSGEDWETETGTPSVCSIQ